MRYTVKKNTHLAGSDWEIGLRTKGLCFSFAEVSFEAAWTGDVGCDGDAELGAELGAELPLLAVRAALALEGFWALDMVSSWSDAARLIFSVIMRLAVCTKPLLSDFLNTRCGSSLSASSIASSAPGWAQPCREKAYQNTRMSSKRFSISMTSINYIVYAYQSCTESKTLVLACLH